MYCDISVRASSSVVRDMDKAIKAFEQVLKGEKLWKHSLVLSRAARAIKRLFDWEENQLVEKGEYELFLCKKLAWYQDVIETVEAIGHDPELYFAELHFALEDYAKGLPADLDLIDEVHVFCITVSESIWDHFMTLHTAEGRSN